MAEEPLARRLLWVLAALCVVSFAALAPHLVYPDLNLDYPFVDGDSHDWIGNGLYLAGHEVRYSGRSPLLPAALATLDRLGLLPWWPLLSLLLFEATVVGFYTLAARLFAPAAAFVAALLLLADTSLQGLALEVMADVPASCLILWSMRAFISALPDAAVAAAAADATDAGEVGEVGEAGEAGGGGHLGSAAAAGDRPRSYAWSGLLAGLGALTQQIAMLLPLAAGATLWARRRRDLATPWPWIGALLAFACQGLWTLVRSGAFAAYGDSLKDNWIFLGFHPAARFYLWSLVSLLGLPACLLLAAGVALAGARAHSGRRSVGAAASLFALLLFAVLLGFFVFFYRYHAKRFLVYAAWPAALLIAEALSPLARLARPAGRACFAVASVLAIGAAALPLPEPAHDASWAALWPLPPLAAHLAAGPPDGAATAAGGGGGKLAVEALPPSSLPGWSVFGRAAHAWAERPRDADRPSPTLFGAAGSALYLFDRQEDGGGRYRTITRLSNALSRPVRFIPRSSLSPYWPLLEVSPLAALTRDYSIYRAALPGLAGYWLLVTPGDRPLDPRLVHPGKAGGPRGRPPLPAGEPARAAAEAAAIAAYVGSGNAYVALFPRPDGADLSQLYLLFLLRTTELYVVEPRYTAATLGLLAGSPLEGERRFGAARVTKTRVQGLRTAAISFLP